MLVDSEELREFLSLIYPSFQIRQVAKASGQRVVYFGIFTTRTKSEPLNCQKWGELVLKISETHSRAAISYVQKEVAVLSELNSPYYPAVYFSDLISIDPRTEEPLNPLRFISMEQKISGEVLSSVIESYNNEVKVKYFLVQILNVMKVLWNHPQKLVHRDLKPDNIIISPDNKINIIDLALLRETGAPGVTNSLYPFGPCSPFYSSPEQAKNDKANISFKSDMFSLGIIAYEMLSGKNPFYNEHEENYIDDVLERICTHEPPNLTELGVSEELSTFIHKLISKEPYKRFRTPELALNQLV
jgi:serine/threonine protein kinase